MLMASGDIVSVPFQKLLSQVADPKAVVFCLQLAAIPIPNMEDSTSCLTIRNHFFWEKPAGTMKQDNMKTNKIETKLYIARLLATSQQPKDTVMLADLNSPRHIIGIVQKLI